MGKPDAGVHIAVVGAGAIGGVTAAFLAQAGWNVELVCKHEKIALRAGTEGLHVSASKVNIACRSGRFVPWRS
jgi:ketopantoate reductase